MPCLAAVKPMIVPPRPALADGRARHVGDPVAFVVADSAEAAREAAELIEVDYEALDAVVDGIAALRRCAAAIWPEVPGNLAYHVQRGDAGAVAKAMAEAAHIVEVEVMNNRIIVTPIEPRVRHRALRRRDRHGGPRADRGRACTASAASSPSSSSSCRSIAFACHAPDVGGGFGMKNFLLSRMDPAAVRGAQARAAGTLAGRSRRGVRHGRAGARHRGDREARPRRRRSPAGARRQDGSPISGPISRQLARAPRWSLPRRRRAASTTFPRSPSRHPAVRSATTVPVDAYRGAVKAKANYIIEKRAIEAAARCSSAAILAEQRRQNPDRVLPAQTGAWHGDRFGRLRRQPRCRRGAPTPRALPPGMQPAKAPAGELLGIGVACFLETLARRAQRRCGSAASRATARSWSPSAPSPTARATRPRSPRSRLIGSAFRSKRSATSRPIPAR